MRTSIVLGALSVVTAMSLAVTASAVQYLDVGLTDPYAVGDIIHGIQAGGQVNRDVVMVNNMLTVSLGSSATIDGELYERSSNDFGVLPAADATDAVMASGGGLNNYDADSVRLTTTDSYWYLVAAYDGPNGGVEIWNISSFDAGTTFDLPRYALPANGDDGPLVEGTKYQMTGWTLLNPTENVPDGGAAAMLLGMAMLGLAVLQRLVRG